MFGWLIEIEIPVENEKTLSNKSQVSLTGSQALRFCRFCHETTDSKR